jgi:hypothetical protein
LGGHQLHGDVDTADHENAFLCFYFTSYFRDELPVARTNMTRLQRAPEGAQHSASSCSNRIVNR